MNYLCVGKIVNTHGIKGEVRILSKFKFKKEVFKVGNKIYIGNDKKELNINSYRVHKNFDMITFKEFNNINDVLIFKNNKVFIDRDSLIIDDYLDEDLIGMDVFSNSKCIGKIKNIEYIKNNNLLIIESKNKTTYIPNNKDFIERVDLEKRRVYIKYIEGLIE
ncbi:MAG: 16S rRNA processing protein RimM [Bacilli bacterium]|nr:16S rRNA processing protein RimM [Bacilli bacterium]